MNHLWWPVAFSAKIGTTPRSIPALGAVYTLLRSSVGLRSAGAIRSGQVTATKNQTAEDVQVAEAYGLTWIRSNADSKPEKIDLANWNDQLVGVGRPVTGETVWNANIWRVVEHFLDVTGEIPGILDESLEAPDKVDLISTSAKNWGISCSAQLISPRRTTGTFIKKVKPPVTQTVRMRFQFPSCILLTAQSGLMITAHVPISAGQTRSFWSAYSVPDDRGRKITPRASRIVTILERERGVLEGKSSVECAASRAFREMIENSLV